MRLQSRELVANFVRQYRKPFSVEILSNLTQLTPAACVGALKELAAAGEAREIEAGIWTGLGQYNVGHSNTAGGMRWTYKSDGGKRILELLRGGRYGAIREIGKALGVSRQYAYLYLEALASIGAVSWEGGRYMATGKGDLTLLGCVIEKGILGRLRREER